MMNSRNEENLKELLKKLLNSEDAEQVEQDIHEGEQILREHSTPVPDKQLIANIKADIARAILRKKATALPLRRSVSEARRRTYYKVAVVAAAVILVAAVSVRLFEKGNGKPEKLVTASIIPDAIWESENLSADDENIAVLTAEIEEVESEFLAVKSGENGGNSFTDLEKLEMELVEINSYFWEG